MSRPLTLRAAAVGGFQPRFIWAPMLAHPWCQPEPPASGGTKPGDALLVGVANEGGTLFRLGGPRDRTAFSLSDDVTTAAWHRAERLAQRYAGTALACELRGSTEPPAPVFVAAHVPPQFTSVTGESYGAAFVLAHASRWLDVAPPVDLVACAKIEDDGALGVVDVDGLEKKLETIWEYALAVKRVVVCEDQKKAAEALARGRFKVHAFEHVAAMVRYVFAESVGQRDAHLKANLELAGTRAIKLEAWVAYRNPQLRAWEAVAEGAEFLSTVLSGRPEARSAAVVAKIARRHTGARGTLIEWPSSDELPAHHELRQRYLAQVVQSSADSDDPEVAGRAVIEAKEHLPPRSSRTPADLVLAGAIGRALAAAGPEKRGDALAWMLDVVDDWFTIDRRDESSYAVCEALRLASLSGDAASLTRLGNALEFWRAAPGAADQRLEESSLWVEFERLRSETLLGRPEAALETARTLRNRMPQANQHLPFASVRWEAVALDQLGRTDEAEALRSTTWQHSDPSTARWLFELDRHVRDGDEAVPPDPPPDDEVTRCLQLLGEQGAHFMQREYRY